MSDWRNEIVHPAEPRASRKWFDACPDAVIYADRDGKTRFWNAAATRIFGFTETEAIDETLDLIVPEAVARPALGGL